MRKSYKPFFNSVRDEVAYLFFSYLNKKGKLRSSEPEYDLLDQIIKKGDTVIDVGSNIGRYSLKCSKLVGSDGRVVAIEPNTRIQSIARLIAQKNGCKNICYVEACVSDQSGLTLFKEDWSAPRSALFSTATRSKIISSVKLTPSLLRESNVEQKLKDSISFKGSRAQESGVYGDLCSKKLCITIDQLGIAASLIKIDVEGYEILVIKGGLNLINLCKPLLIVEDNGGDYTVLLEMGYIKYQIEGSRNFIFCHSIDARGDIMQRLIC